MTTQKKNWKRALIIGIAILLLLAAVSMAAASVIFHFIFQRQPESRYTLLAGYSASDEQRYPRTQVSFPSGGHTLNGYIYGAGNRRGVIVFAHGLHSSAEGHLAEVFYFVDDGWTVFTFDGTGAGKSEGDNAVGLTQMRLDLLAALDFAGSSGLFAGLPVLLYGHSAGGYATATLCGDARVSAVVSISGFDSPLDLMAYHARGKAGILADIGYPFLLAYDRLLFGGESRVTASDCLAEAGCPALVVQGAADETVPYEFSIYAVCREDCPENVTLTLVDEEYRDRHSTVWLTAGSAKEFLSDSAYREAQLHAYGKEGLPKEVAERLLQNASDAKRFLRDVDEEFLREVSLFFRNAVNTAQ